VIDLTGGSVVVIARRLLGAHLVSAIDGVEVRVRLTEVEAYGGEDDPASHAFRGETPRNRAMFGPSGRLYVYRSYGVHWCANVVTGRAGAAQAVLLRGGDVVAGRDAVIQRRGRSDHLADGPGKLAQAMAIVGAHDGHDLVRPPIWLEEAPEGCRPHGSMIASPRIAISRATDRPWRFVLGDPPDSEGSPAG